MAARLVAPDVAYEVSCRAYVAELAAANERPVPFDLRLPMDDFGAYVRGLAERARRSPGFVPNSTFWLVEGDQLIAVANLRHRLNRHLRQHGGHIGYGVRPSWRGRGNGTLLLRRTLEEARRRRIRRVLITCAKDNVASAGVARANGGVLTNEHWHSAEEPSRPGYLEQHYWIDLRAGGGAGR